MNTIKIDKKSTKIIAHRGQSCLETENTNAAFIAAGNRMCFGIETDVYKTKDGKYVLLHDGNTGRLCDVEINVWDSTFEEIRSIRLRDGFTGKAREDLIIPTLDEYISTCKKYGKTAVLEFKSDFAADEIKEIVGIINEFEYFENVIFISFHFSALILLRKLFPEAKIQFLTGDFNDELTENLVKYKFDVDIGYWGLTAEQVNIFHQNGIKVNCWTCDNKEDAEKLIDFGVDFITSNILE